MSAVQIYIPQRHEVLERSRNTFIRTLDDIRSQSDIQDVDRKTFWMYSQLFLQYIETQITYLNDGLFDRTNGPTEFQVDFTGHDGQCVIKKIDRAPGSLVNIHSNANSIENIPAHPMHQYFAKWMPEEVQITESYGIAMYTDFAVDKAVVATSAMVMLHILAVGLESLNQLPLQWLWLKDCIKRNPADRLSLDEMHHKLQLLRGQHSYKVMRGSELIDTLSEEEGLRSDDSSDNGLSGCSMIEYDKNSNLQCGAKMIRSRTNNWNTDTPCHVVEDEDPNSSDNDIQYDNVEDEHMTSKRDRDGHDLEFSISLRRDLVDTKLDEDILSDPDSESSARIGADFGDDLEMKMSLDFIQRNTPYFAMTRDLDAEMLFDDDIKEMDIMDSLNAIDRSLSRSVTPRDLKTTLDFIGRHSELVPVMQSGAPDLEGDDEIAFEFDAQNISISAPKLQNVNQPEPADARLVMMALLVAVVLANEQDEAIMCLCLYMLIERYLIYHGEPIPMDPEVEELVSDDIESDLDSENELDEDTVNVLLTDTLLGGAEIEGEVGFDFPE